MQHHPTHPEQGSRIRARWWLWLAPIVVLVALGLWVIPEKDNSQNVKHSVGVPIGTSGTPEPVRRPTTTDARPAPDAPTPEPARASPTRNLITGPRRGLARGAVARAASAPLLSESVAGALPAVAAGAVHVVVLTDAGTVWTWRYNSNGQVGDGTTRRG